MGKVLHASASGYFPFCIVGGGPVGSGTNRPLGMSLEDAMFLYWRIKSIKLTAPSSTKTQVISSIYGSEESMVCHSEDDPAIIGGTVEDNSTSSPPLNLEFLREGTLFLNGIFSNQPRVIRVGDLYYPNIYIEFLDQIITIDGEELQAGFFSSNRNAPGLVQPSFFYGTFAFLGIGDIDMYVGQDFTGGSFGGISIEEYWSFGGTYNTSTGLPL